MAPVTTLPLMPADFIARLGSRALAPGEVTSRWGIGEYVDLLAGDLEPAEIDERLRRIAHGQARRLRRLDPERLLALLTAMARPPAAELNKARLAAAAAIPATTLSPYVDVLEDLGLIRLLPGATSPIANRAVARPRVVIADPGINLHLSGVATERLLQLDGRRQLAPFLEGIVITALLDQRASSSVEHRISHLRERNGLAVDVLVELADNTLYGLEVRTASGLRPHQFRGLEALAARAGARFRGGIVLNTAARGHQYRRGMWGLPIASVWEDGAPSLGG